jgi:DNA-binding response OmpR family regulator
LIVEDEPAAAFALANDLRTSGHVVSITADGCEAVFRARSGSFDVILLDTSLPGKSGFEVCRELRRHGLRTPIILLSDRNREDDKVMGLDLGADDYVTRPFGARELRARIRALIRRAAPGIDRRSEVFQFGYCELDLERFELRREGRLDSTPTEIRLLAALIRTAGAR